MFPGKTGNEAGHFGNDAIRITVLVVERECEYPRRYDLKNLHAIIILVLSS